MQPRKLPRKPRSAADAALIRRAEMETFEARARLEQALMDEEAASGLDHPRVAAALSTLGRFLFETGYLGQAERMFERALAIQERTHGPAHPAHPELAAPLADLAMVKALGRPAEAAPLLQRALAIDEEVLGPQHPTVARRLSALGMVLYDLGNAAEARLLLERALALDEEARGPASADVAAGLSNLALVLRALGEPELAARLLERAVAIQEARPGPGEHG